MKVHVAAAFFSLISSAEGWLVDLDSSRRQGAFFFGDQNGEESFLISMPSVNGKNRGSAASQHQRGHLSTVLPTAVEALAVVTVEVIMFVRAIRAKGDGLGEDHRWSFLLLLQVVIWAAVSAISKWRQALHRRSRVQGFLRFYKETLLLRKMPFVIVSSGTAAMLLLLALWKPYDRHLDMALSEGIQILYSVEAIVYVCFAIPYLVKVIKFNRSTARPDAYREMLEHSSLPAAALGEGGYDVADRSAEVNDMLEKQADVIRFQRQHTQHLSRRIRALEEKLEAYEKAAE